MAETVRIGMIVPSGGPEGDYYRYEEASSGAVKFYFTISRAGGEPGQDHDPAALRETGQIDRLCEAAERRGRSGSTPCNGRAPAAVSSWAARLRSCRRAS